MIVYYNKKGDFISITKHYLSKFIGLFITFLVFITNDNKNNVMKEKKILWALLSFILFTSLLFSCSKTKNTKPNGKLQLHFNLINTSLLLGTNTVKSNLTWDEGFMNVNSIGIDNILGEIEGKKSSESELDSKEMDSTSIVNFFIPNQKFLNVNITPGSYSNIKIRVDITQTATSPALYLKGKFFDNQGNLIPVEFSLNEGSLDANLNNQQDGEFHGGENNGLELVAFAKNLIVDPQNIATATVNLDFKLLFNGINDIDFQNATRVNGVIVINKSINSAIYNVLKTNINKFSRID